MQHKLFSKENTNARPIPQLDITSAVRLRLAVQHIENNQWQKLKRIITVEPGILKFELNLIEDNNKFEFIPTILYFIQSHADDSIECKQVLDFIMNNSDWNQTDWCFGNTLVTYVIATQSTNVINRILDFVENNKPDLLTVENKNHRDAKNTPLLIAIKNGDKKTALRLIPYYNEKDLLSLSKQGNSALHLACYLKMNDIIFAIIDRAKTLKCLDSVLSQKNSENHTPLILYKANFERPNPTYRQMQITHPNDIAEYADQATIIENKYYIQVMVIGQETHTYIYQFNEEITKHGFNYERDSDKIISSEIENSLIPFRPSLNETTDISFSMRK